MKFKEK